MLLICIIILLNFSSLYALEIQETFDSVAKNTKTDKKYVKPDVLEKKSDKFNIRITQNSVNIYSTLKKAQDSIESGNRTEAISLLNQVTAKFPYHKNALIGLGNIYYANKEYERATKIYQRLLKEYPNHPYILENFLTIVSHYDPNLALSEMLKLLETHKHYAPLLANLGLLYMDKKDFAKAKEYMITAVSLNQSNVFYTYNLAVILDNLSDFKNAATFYEKSLSMSKNESTIIPTHKVAARLKFIKLQTAANLT